MGAIAAAYPNGTIVIVSPDLDAAGARELAERVRNAAARIEVAAGNAGRISLSVATATGQVTRGVERSQLLTRAMSLADELTGAGGDRTGAIELSSPQA
jgi:hypothetical protein